MGSKKTSGNVICLLSELGKAKCAHCIHLADGNGVKKNERNCYLFALIIRKSQNVARASPRRHKTVQNGLQKNERFQKLKLSNRICFQFFKNMKKSAYARFFRSIYSFFSLFEMGKNPEKSEKIRKNVQKIAFFKVFSYALHHFLRIICIM